MEYWNDAEWNVGIMERWIVENCLDHLPVFHRSSIPFSNLVVSDLVGDVPSMLLRRHSPQE
jgi:hypothetical protein